MTRPITDAELSAERTAAETAFERDLAEFQKRRAKEIPKAPLSRTAPQADARAGRVEHMSDRSSAYNPSRKIMHAIEDHHRAVGGYLKAVEAHLTHLRYTTYLNNREVDKALDNINKAIQSARPLLDRSRTRSLGGRPGGDTYFGPELDALHRLVYTIETLREVHRENIKAARQLDREIPLESDGGIPASVIRRHRKLQLADAERAPLADEVEQELDAAVNDVIDATRLQPRLLDTRTQTVPLAAASQPAAITDRHADLRAALIANPDQPQTSFVEQFRVHPITVRRCRRELEEAGEIPVLAHRHGPTGQRDAPLAEAAD